MKGDILNALYWNPFGILLVSILIITPLWIIYDLASRNSTLLNAYIKTEHFLKRKWIAIPAILLVLMNWVWNISKGL